MKQDPGRLNLIRLVKKIYRLLKHMPLHVIGTITHVSTRSSVAALTFDDGPDPDFTPRLLDILAKHNAYATFFMIGKAAERYPEIVQQVKQAGHAIGNHSWDHSSFRTINGRRRRQQIRACSKAIAPYGQRLFRPPYGDQSIKSRIDAFLLRHKVVTWNMHVFDWEKHDSKWMLDKLVGSLMPGSIILFHDSLWDTIIEGAEDRLPMFEALDMFLEKVGREYHFITIPELLKYGHAIRQNWCFDSKIATYTFYRKARL